MELTILGCNSAVPTVSRNPSAQVLAVGGSVFLIDCGEGTQFQLRRFHVGFMRIEAIFISHMHGDHVFGLIGLLSTMSLFNRTSPLTVFGPPELDDYLSAQLPIFCDNISFAVKFRPLRYDRPEILHEVKSVFVKSIPLRHRVKTCGFLFREQVKAPSIKKTAIFKYGLTIADIVSIKNGRPFFDVNGDEVPRGELVNEPPEPRSYAYMSDTAYLPSLAAEVEGVSLLYHEATFLSDMSGLAAKTLHSTARQAAQFAKLAKAGRLILGHFSSRYENTDVFEAEAQQVFADATAVYDGFRIIF